MVYDYIFEASLKTFVEMLNEQVKDGWTPIWNTFNYEMGDSTSGSVFTVILEKNVTDVVAEFVDL